jgi:uroporphyrinogen-III synthase
VPESRAAGTPPVAIVSRAAADAPRLAAPLSERGFEVRLAPAIERQVFPQAWSAALQDHRRVDFILLASAQAARIVAQGPALSSATKVVAVGPHTAATARELGLTVHRVPSEYTGAAAVRAMRLRRDDILLYPSPSVISSSTRAALDASLASVSTPVVYGNRQPDDFAARLADASPCDVMPLMSPSAARRVSRELRRLGIAAPPVTVVGPSTREAASAGGLRVVAVAWPHTVTALADATWSWWHETHDVSR